MQVLEFSFSLSLQFFNLILLLTSPFVSWTILCFLNSSPILVWVLIQSLDSPVHIPIYNSLRINKVISISQRFSLHPACGLSVRHLYLSQLKHSALGLSSNILWTLSEKGSDALGSNWEVLSVASLIFLTVMVPMQGL